VNDINIVRSTIEIRNARHHNLTGIDVSIPLFGFTVVTGPSGSGKSTLALDVLFAEGRNRYLDSLGNGRSRSVDFWERPQIDAVMGLPPPVAMEQGLRAWNPRSTVATVTDIGHLLRILFSLEGSARCPFCGTSVTAMTIDEMAETILELPEGTRFLLLAPIPGEGRDMEGLVREGFHRVLVAGHVREIAELSPEESGAPDMDVVVDRLVMRAGIRPRLVDSLALALKLAKGAAAVEVVEGHAQRFFFTDTLSCAACGVTFPALSPGLFSKKRPEGICNACSGAGCPDCEGTGLNAFVRGILLHGRTFLDLMSTTLDGVAAFLSQASIGRPGKTSGLVIDTLLARISSLQSLGLGYLVPSRPVTTLSGGEFQRLRISAQIGKDLTGILYILDEPGVGLHPLEREALLEHIFRLRDGGNTVMVIEHDMAFIQRADHVIELGPGSGDSGGRLLFSGHPARLADEPRSVTGPYLSGTRRMTRARRPMDQGWIRLQDSRVNNLKDVTVSFPVRALVAVTGVSGSGKSSLVLQGLAAAVRGTDSETAPACGRVTHDLPHGMEPPRSVYVMDQAPLTGTKFSLPVTYLGAFTPLRNLFAGTPAARERGVTAAYFSLTGRGGRCERCGGLGYRIEEFDYLPPVTSPCDVCGGNRYQKDALEIRFKGFSMADVLNFTAQRAAEVFARFPPLRKAFEGMERAGIGYIKIGQPVMTLSGGEAQRLRFARCLQTKGRLPGLFLFDELSRGLHPRDMERILPLLDGLIDQGNSVIIIEHKPEILAIVDWIIELGPGGGPSGGEVIAKGTPGEIARNEGSRIGPYLGQYL